MRDLPKLDLDPFPEVDLRHVLVLTDETAMFQHAAYGTPDLDHGYCTDDNARAAIAAVKAIALNPGLSSGHDALTVPLQRYLAFLKHAFSEKRGRFRNFMGYDRQWLERVGSADSHGRALWAFGVIVCLAPTDGTRALAEELFRAGLPAFKEFDDLRPWAFGLLGLHEYLGVVGGDEDAHATRSLVAAKLLDCWKAESCDAWPWWENRLTWGNARLPHALLVSGCDLDREEMVAVGLKALRWLLDVQTAKDGHLSVVGNNGWYVRDGVRARFDQQPIEAFGLVEACLAAARATGDKHWTGEAVRCFQWFTGRNDLGSPLYDADTGGCYDGLMAQGVNNNQGAESTLAYVLSVLDLHEYQLLL